MWEDDDRVGRSVITFFLTGIADRFGTLPLFVRTTNALAFYVDRLSSFPALMSVDCVSNATCAAAINTPKLGGTVTGIPSPGIGASGFMDIIRAQWEMPAR